MHKVLGIIGGMGPMATVDLFSLIVQLTEAKKDSEHIHILIDNYPQIPDRTTSIINGDDKPLPFLREAAVRLEQQGADIIIIPCNTSHYYIKQVQESIKIPILNMIEEVAKRLVNEKISRVGLFATDGVIDSKIYDNVLLKYGIQTYLPDEIGQKKVMNLIYNEVKAGICPHPELLYPEFDKMKSLGVEAFILGCTELPLVFATNKNYKFINCTEELAKAAIRECGYRVKLKGEM